MKKPDPSLLALYHIGVIGGIEIDYRHMHTPRGGTYVRLRGNLGSIGNDDTHIPGCIGIFGGGWRWSGRRGYIVGWDTEKKIAGTRIEGAAGLMLQINLDA